MVDINDKYQGALLGSAIGDALGWPNEFNSGNTRKQGNKDNKFIRWNRKCRNPFWHVDEIEPGEYSDDTQLMLAVSRSLLYKEWKKCFTEIEYPFWLEYERGGGRAVKRAAIYCKKKDVPWKNKNNIVDYYTAGGNGGLMRILPHVIRNIDKSLEEMIDEVIDDVIISHGHPRAILGATCYAYALYYLFHNKEIMKFSELIDVLIDGIKIWGGAPNQNKFAEWLSFAEKNNAYDYDDEWNNCYLFMSNMLHFIKKSLDEGLMSDDNRVLELLGAFSKNGGAGDVTILSAVYFFSKYVNTPELAVSIPACTMGIDTDTIASITGGLVGAFYGIDWIPIEWKTVQDYSYICNIAKDLGAGTIIKSLLSDENKLLTLDTSKMELLNIKIINSKYSNIKICKYKTSFGQTIYIKSILPKKEETQNNDTITLSLDSLQEILDDEKMNRITIKKALNILILKKQGFDEDTIIKRVKVNKELVQKLFKAIK